MQEQQVHLQALQVIINGLVNFSSILASLQILPLQTGPLSFVTITADPS